MSFLHSPVDLSAPVDLPAVDRTPDGMQEIIKEDPCRDEEADLDKRMSDLNVVTLLSRFDDSLIAILSLVDLDTSLIN